ncbi:MAG TPA: substrate-binding domain-containing protein, partial [Planctomycetota bacterium]|nr:substrate-binding domain-containing protein [Planctomycetota bacterium]
INQQQDSAGHCQLCRDAAEGGLAGVVFLHAPHYLVGSPVLTQTLPRVVIAGRRRDVVPFRASAIEFATIDPLEEIVRRFAADGRSRIAGITSPNAGFLERCRPLLRQLKMDTRPEWWLGLPVAPSVAPCAHDVARLLLSAPAKERPDCLIISDDNLVPHAIAGVLATGVKVPRDLAIAAHANFPVPTPASVPCLRYGVDMEEMLTAAISEVQRLAAGGAPDVVRVQVRVSESRP